MKKNQCPCCGFYTISSVEFNICPVCYWENDYFQFQNPDSEGDVNKMSLNRARESYKKIGASDEKFLRSVRKPLKDEIQE